MELAPMRLQKHQLAAYSAHRRLGLPIEGFVMPPPLPRKKRDNEESRLQIAFVKWWKNNCKHFSLPEISLASCPNGGGRSGPIVGSILKKEGLRAGFPDLGLYAARGRCHALFLELKRPAGVVSPEQVAFHQMLTDQGYRVAVCRSLQQCIDAVTTYLTK